MAENVLQNIQSIELGSLVIDDVNPTHCIMFQTARNRYCFRLSESYPVEKQVAMFRQFIVDINTPMEQPQFQQPAEQPVEEVKEEVVEEVKGE